MTFGSWALSDEHGPKFALICCITSQMAREDRDQATYSPHMITITNHLKEKLLDQAQARAPCNPVTRVIRVAYPHVPIAWPTHFRWCIFSTGA